MESTSSVHWSVWVGRVLSGVAIFGTSFSGIMKLTHGQAVMDSFVGHLGFSEGAVTPIGVVELLCTALHAFPKTRVLGALLLTAYLGGATAAHVRLGDPFVAPVVLGVMVWAGLYLRDAGVRSLLPLRSP